MYLTSFDPFTQEFDRLTRRAFGTVNGGVMPMDGLRRDGDVVLRFDVPGIDPDSIEVTVDRGFLTVSAKREEAELGENERLFVKERRTGSFTRRVRLSERLDADAIEAAYSNGVLEVRIPVTEQAKPRKVEIQRGESEKAIAS